MPPFEFDVINYWSEVKLDIIKDYAKAYSTIMAKQSWCQGHFYIDAFAGAGMHISRATGEFIAGSPLNAVNTVPPFTHYYLIDLDSGKTDNLRQLTKEFQNVTVFDGNCNNVLMTDVFPPLLAEKFCRSLCILDPYGLHFCKHCYANRLALRLQAIGQPNYRNGFEVTLHPHTLEIPLGWKKSRTIFVNSMSDLFHPEVPISFIQEVFSTMATARWHRFQVLTKRPERVKSLDEGLGWTENIWMGTSVESQDYVHRIDPLRETNAHIKFLSLEPLLGRLRNLDLRQIDWVIVGGESGPGARAMNPDWVREIRDHCRDEGVAFFFKQWGGVFKKRTGRILDGKTWDELPEYH